MNTDADNSTESAEESNGSSRHDSATGNRTSRKIVVIGGNFAGLSAARAIAELRDVQGDDSEAEDQLPSEIDVCIIDPQEHFIWTPNIHELVSGVKQPRAVQLSRKDLLCAFGHDFVKASVRKMDLAEHCVELDTGENIAFDACLIACGTSARAMPSSAAKTTMTGTEAETVADTEQASLLDALHQHHRFRTPSDITNVHQAIEQRIEETGQARVTIIGGGFSGIEALGEVLRRYRKHPGLTVNLLERSSRLLRGLPEVVAEDIGKLTQRLNVHYQLNTRVTDVDGSRLMLSDGGELDSDVTIWTQGGEINPMLRASGLFNEPGAKQTESPCTNGIKVSPSLQTQAFPGCFVAGDAAAISPPLRKQSYHAIDMGQLAGRNLIRWLNGDALEEYQPQDKPVLLSFGDLNTYLVAGNSVIASPALATAKELIYQLSMLRLSQPLPLAIRGCATIERLHASINRLLLPELLHPRPLQFLTRSRILQFGGSQDLASLINGVRSTLWASY